ncbi:hypothetical protein L1857_32340 [Amycolatopsis thermalba]|uniref:Transmembrane protein n=1 Tax=Amycolatopsis thermalba TaxID=944492 RepID=A0ABY4P469_9PSEU|nr:MULTISPECIES: VC0807 family protein [Amycolatopsis]UQS27161.1 hypothetical protein L1857_32340 [Amycolatopsis thermalba]
MTNKTSALAPLIIDAGLPVAAYFLLSQAAGLSTIAALAWSSAIPAVRAVWCLARERRVNVLAVLMLVVNTTGLLSSLLTGDPRLMLAKDGGVTSILGVGILASVVIGKPLMTEVLRPLFTKGDPARTAVWDGLSGTSPAFRRAERLFSVVWGVALLGESAVRVVGAYTLPVDTMVWLGGVILVVALAAAFAVSRAAARPMVRTFLAAFDERRQAYRASQTAM